MAAEGSSPFRRLFAHTRKGVCSVRFILCCLPLLVLCCSVLAQNGFRDLGIGAPVIESRGVVATVDDNGNSVVVAQAAGFALVTDVDTGESVQVPTLPGMPQAGTYGSVLAANRKHYMGKDNHIAEFDPTTRSWTYHAVGAPVEAAYIGVTEGPTGTIWAGGYPHAHLVSFDYVTRMIKDHGQMDPTEQYISHIAADDAGWVYMGIGTARSNIVAYNPATGERRQLVDEADRITNTAYVYPCADGRVYGSNNGKWYRLYEGKAEQIEAEEAGKAEDVGSIYWPSTRCELPDGRQIIEYALPERYLRVHNPATGETKAITFDYTTPGAHISSTGPGPDGSIYSSSGHPMHLIRYNPAADELTDLGPIPTIGGGHINMITRMGNYLLGGSYAGGHLWAYDVTRPWNPSGIRPSFPMPAERLARLGSMPEGEIKHIPDHDVVFFKSDHYGAQAEFTLTARENGQYYLHVVPYLGSGYCTLQFSFDGKEIAEPYVATNEQLVAGNAVIVGPMELDAGEHVLGVRLVDNDSPNPWGALCGVELSTQRREDLGEMTPLNPIPLAQWATDIGRPTYVLAHADGRTIFMTGYPGYGRCGGGMGIYDMEIRQAELLTADENLLRGQTTVELKALSPTLLLGACSSLALTGGHRIANEAELYLLSWPEKQVVFHTVPVNGANVISSCTIGADGLVYAITDTKVFFVFDPQKREVTHREDFSAYGGPAALGMHTGPDGRIYLLMSKAVVRVTPGSLEHESLGQPPAGVGAGGALVDGVLYYSAGSHVWAFDVPGL